MKALFGFLLFISPGLHAGSLHTWINWKERRPALAITVSAEAGPGLKQLAVPFKLIDDRSRALWGTDLVVPLEGPGPWKKSFPLDLDIRNPEKPRQLRLNPGRVYQVQVRINEPALDLQHSEDLFYRWPSGILHSYSMLYLGSAPNHRVLLRLGLFPNAKVTEPVPLLLSLQDEKGNRVELPKEDGAKEIEIKIKGKETVETVRKLKYELEPPKELTEVKLNVSPDTSEQIGPFKLTATLGTKEKRTLANITRSFATRYSLLSFNTDIEWKDKMPHLVLTGKAAVSAFVPGSEFSHLGVPFSLMDSDEKKLWAARLKLTPDGSTELRASYALNMNVSNPRRHIKVKLDPGKQHQIRIRVNDPVFAVKRSEDIFVSKPAGLLRFFGFQYSGTFPDDRIRFRLDLAGFKGRGGKKTPITFTIRDSEENEILSRQHEIKPAAQAESFEFDVTPDTSKSLGPYELDVNIESESYGLYFNTSKKFALANAHIPVTSMERGDPNAWFEMAKSHTHRGVAVVTVPNQRNSQQLYYSPHLADHTPRDYPEITYDTTDKKSGRQSLRVNYRAGTPTWFWGGQPLPGKPTMLTLWVKGNGSGDRLVVAFEDHINHVLPAWYRYADFKQETVCTLDFTDWRRFRVPVLGGGLQQEGMKGSTPKIDAPISILAFILIRNRSSKVPGGTPLSLHIDDIGVETQADVEEYLSMELQYSDPLGRLLPDAVLHVAVGNGSKEELKKGRVMVSARVVSNEPVWNAKQDMAVPADGYETVSFPVKALAGHRPAGPIELDITFTDPTRPGMRISKRFTLKNAIHGGLVHDFEKPMSYSGIKPTQYAWNAVIPSPARIVQGGPDSKFSLEIPVTKLEEKEDPASVLLHPSLPGIPQSVELMVKGGPHPVELQPWLIDSGYTGIWNRGYDMFWPEKILVDWQGWKKVVIQTPAIPPHHGDRNRRFLKQPWYPLNLAFEARLAGHENKTSVFLDDVRVVSHLKPEEVVQGELLFPHESKIHPAGSPLQISVTNFEPGYKPLKLHFELQNYQGFLAESGKLPLKIPAGEKEQTTVVESLDPGIYELKIKGINEATLQSTIMVLDMKEYFGDDPLAHLSDPVKLRKALGLTTEKILLDFDNAEPAPNLHHFNWYEKEIKKRTNDGQFKAVPVVGFSADWAGPDSVDALANAAYQRYIPNTIMTPVRLIDWNRFVREMVREYKGRFPEWTFWDNPDLDDSPQSIEPKKYGQMLEIFHRWVKLYQPDARVVAGGFNFDKVLSYLDRMKDPAALKFDDFAVQMNIGELSPEQVDLDAFMAELNETLKTKETGRRIRMTELDWHIGEYVTPLQQAAYHARATMLLNSSGALPHNFSLINTGFSYEGLGVFYRQSYGNSESVRGGGAHLPYHIPKPSYFALIEIGKFLKNWKFAKGVRPSGKSLDHNRSFIYQNAAGELTAAIWRAVPIQSGLPATRLYELPANWGKVKARDLLGFPVDLSKGLKFTALPSFIQMPKGYKLAQLSHDLRMLRAVDGTYPVMLDLHLGETESVKRPQYKATGKTSHHIYAGQIPGGGKVREQFLTGIENETFKFTTEKPGNVLLRRRWHFDGEGQKLRVSVNDGKTIAWDLTKGKDNAQGIRESTLVLRNCKAGENTIAITHGKAGNSSGYRLEPMPEEHLSLDRMGIFNARQSTGSVVKNVSAAGTPLRLPPDKNDPTAKTTYERGLGAHSVSFLEYPLNGQFESFEVTVGIDGSTEGRGSAVFRIFADSKEVANSKVLNGFSKPLNLKVEGLGNVRRLILSVLDAGDGSKHDLANWVDGKLYLRK
ncbi:MAG: NPCBM/NEW2 domain-containing protein [Planctomycetota bacterium]|nr:NPCBM/NEW2 domain-containing protein [Planctomycetota bacterium]